MAIWKKSEDPWDRKPGRDWLNEKKPKEPRENPIESLKAWNEKRKAEQAERIPALIPCPWCGKPMETGYIMSSNGIFWGPGIPSFQAKWISNNLAKGAFRIDTEGGISGYQTAWRCQECGKAVFNIPEPRQEYDLFASAEAEETEEEETSEE